MKKLVVLTFVLVGIALPSATLKANVTYNFYCISSNDPTGKAGEVGESAFYVTVSDPGTAGQALFTFGVLEGFGYPEPTDPDDGYYIDGVYFYDGVLLEIAQIIDADDGVGGDPDVDFSGIASPDHLPGFDPGDYPTLVYGYKVDEADADSSPSKNGIHAGETLGVLFNLTSGNTYNELITAMNSGQVIVGIKAQGFGEYSESFIHTPTPGAILLGSIGVGLVGWLRRRRNL